MFKDVFISYAKEDITFAEQLYDYLLENGFSPWLDKRKLRVGANWDYEIKKALKEATFVVLLLSDTSVRKRGYVQREFKYALEYSETKLEDDIYILPILLNDCVVPDHLMKFQWVSAETEDIQQSILESLKFQRKRYLETLSPDKIQLNDFDIISINLGASLEKKVEYKCAIPLFHNNQYFDENFVNTMIQAKAFTIISHHRKWIMEIMEDDSVKSGIGYIDIGYGISMLNKNFISMAIATESFLGGAHPSNDVSTLNIQFGPERILTLSDLVEYHNLSDFLIGLIKRFGDAEQKDFLLNYVEFMTEGNLNFSFTESQLSISFENILPRAFMALAVLEIPIKNIDWKL